MKNYINMHKVLICILLCLFINNTKAAFTTESAAEITNYDYFLKYEQMLILEPKLEKPNASQYNRVADIFNRSSFASPYFKKGKLLNFTRPTEKNYIPEEQRNSFIEDLFTFASFFLYYDEFKIKERDQLIIKWHNKKERHHQGKKVKSINDIKANVLDDIKKEIYVEALSRMSFVAHKTRSEFIESKLLLDAVYKAQVLTFLSNILDKHPIRRLPKFGALIELNHVESIKFMAMYYFYGKDLTIGDNKPLKSVTYDIRSFHNALLYLKKLNSKESKFLIGNLYLKKYYEISLTEGKIQSESFKVDIRQVKSIFQEIDRVGYFDSIVRSSTITILESHKSLFPKLDFNLVAKKDIHESNAYKFINQLSEYKDIFREIDVNYITYSILDRLNSIKQNKFPEYEKRFASNILENKISSNLKDSWTFENDLVQNLSTQQKENLFKSYNLIVACEEYFVKFPNGILKRKVQDIAEEAYDYTKYIFNSKIQNKKIAQSYASVFPKSPYAAYFKNYHDIQLRRKQEQFQDRIIAYNDLAENYAYLYMKEISPNTGYGSYYRFKNNDDFDKDERVVSLLWQAKLVSGISGELFAWALGAKNNYEEFEITGSINVKNGKFRHISSNEYVSTANQLKSYIEVGQEVGKVVLKYAIKAAAYIAAASAENSSYSSSSNTSNAVSNNANTPQTKKCVSEYYELTGDKRHKCGDYYNVTYHVNCGGFGNTYRIFYKAVDNDNRPYVCDSGQGMWFIWYTVLPNEYISTKNKGIDGLQEAVSKVCGCNQ